jgi:prolyl 4-hydroxylase
MNEIDPSKPYIFTVANVLSPKECAELIERIERDGPSVAPITTPGGPVVDTQIRNNERVMFDDPDLAQTLFERVRHRLPKVVLGAKAVGANERIRCYRYRPGMYFAPHADGAFYRDDVERSRYSFLVYLNEGFEGGETAFFVKPEVKIKPETGLGLLFQHPIVHEGSPVVSGVKYVVRTDVMYRR